MNTGDILKKYKFKKNFGDIYKNWENFGNFCEKILKKYEKVFEISCNFQENLKKMKGIKRKYFIIVDNFVEIYGTFKLSLEFPIIFSQIILKFSLKKSLKFYNFVANNIS